MILPPFGKDGWRGEKVPLPRNFPLAIRANLVKRRVKEKLETGGSRIEITSALSMNQLYYTCDDLVWNFISSLFAPNFLPSSSSFRIFFFFFPRLGEHIFHSLIKPYIFGWDNVFLHFWDDSVLSILSRSFWIKSNLFIYLWDSLIIFLSGNNFLIHLQKRSEKREFQ